MAVLLLKPDLLKPDDAGEQRRFRLCCDVIARKAACVALPIPLSGEAYPGLRRTKARRNIGLEPRFAIYGVFERSGERFAVRENASKYDVRASVLIQSEPIRL